MRILVLGVTGMLGNTLFKSLSKNKALDVYGTTRSTHCKHFPELEAKIITDIHAENFQSFIKAFMQAKPDVVINCIGIIKQLPQANDPLKAIAINAYLPHQLSELCQLMQCRFMHISTDCVFSGDKGGYGENDLPDAKDMYGRSKLLGEVHDSLYNQAIRAIDLQPELLTQHIILKMHEAIQATNDDRWTLSKEEECVWQQNLALIEFSESILKEINNGTSEAILCIMWPFIKQQAEATISEIEEKIAATTANTITTQFDNMAQTATQPPINTTSQSTSYQISKNEKKR